MKSQRFWVALFVALPLAFAAWALKISFDKNAGKSAFEPVAVGSFYLEQESEPWPDAIEAGRDFVVSKHVSFDLKSGRAGIWKRGGLVVTADSPLQSGTLTWEFVEDLRVKPHIVVREGTRATAYDLPDSYEFDMAQTPDAEAHVYARAGSVAMLTDRHFTRWKQNRRAPEKVMQFSKEGEASAELTRDWKSIVVVDFDAISTFSTKDGQRLRRLKSPAAPQSEWVECAPGGSYALFDDASKSVAGQKWHWDVFDARTGRAVWNFKIESAPAWIAWNPQMTRVALPLPSRGVWEIYRFPQGQLERAIPLAPGAKRGAFSPDGNTFYSVAGGKLYRQRAR